MTTKKIFQALRFTTALIVLSLALAACGAKKNAPADKVAVQLSWFPSVEFAGFYAALENGYYADENLEVTLIPGGPEINPLDAVESGAAQFGISTSDSLIIARSEGQNYVAVSAIYGQNPLVVMTLSDSQITKPEDLAGKTVGVFSSDLSTVWDIQFLALLQKTNVDRESVAFTLINDYHGANELTSGNMDAMSGSFATNEPVQARLDGNDVSLIYYKDYGVDVYSNVIFTTEELTQNNAELVSRMIRATMKGYQFAVENPATAVELSLTRDPALDLALQTNTMQAQIPLIDTGGAPIGSMDASVWETTQQILLDFNLISAPIDLNAIYTNKFIAP